MSRMPVPDVMVDSVFELTPDVLSDMGIRLLLLDLDNTISPYGEKAPQQELRDWLDSLLSAGIEPFILSNNRGTRPEVFALALGIGYVSHAGKPSAKAVTRLLEERDMEKHEAALAGDQIFTDVWCAKRAGITAIAVEPMDIKNIFRKIRYTIEKPFRAAGRKDEKK